MEEIGVERKTKTIPIRLCGAMLGLVAFLVAGLLPSLLYGGYAGLVLGGAIFGTPIHESVFAQATVIIGVISSVLVTGGVFVLGGAILATGVHGLFSELNIEPERMEEAEAGNESV
jgi:hypothetical protein